MTTQPEALRLAAELDDGYPLTGDAISAAAELRSQHARITELEAQLSAIGAGGVSPLMNAAQEATHLRELAAYRLTVENLEREIAAQQPAPSPAPAVGQDDLRAARSDGYAQGVASAVPKKVTADMRRVFREAYREGGFLADRLDYALDRMLAAAHQPPPTPQADTQPAPVRDGYPPLPECQGEIFDDGYWIENKLGPKQDVMGGAQVWLEDQMRAYVDSDRAARAQADSVTAPAGGVDDAVDAIALARYKVVPAHESMFHRFAVVAGDGKQQLYLGREIECENMARKFAGAFLDGAFYQANITPSTQAAGSVPAVEREQERIAFKDAHRHLELYEVPDAWGRPMFKHSHVEASWLGWIARASHGQAPAETGNSVSAQADSVPAIQGETNVQLDTDPNPTAPGQQRDMACSLALGQPVGNGSDQVAGHPSAQGDKLLTVAERNIRSFLRSATFKSESDREAALNCVDVLWEAARAPADSVLEDAAPSYTSLQLAEMVLSDCGCSTNNTSLLERVAKRIHVHVVAARKQGEKQ